MTISEIRQYKQIIYIPFGLDDEIEGTIGAQIHLNYEIESKYKELLDSYMKELGIETKKAELRGKLSLAEKGDFDSLVNEYNELNATEQIIILLKDNGLKMEKFNVPKEKGPGVSIMQIKYKGTEPIYFRDIFDWEFGAKITGVEKTAKPGCGMVTNIDSDGYKVVIENQMKGIICNIEW